MSGIKKMLENRRNREAVYSRSDYWDEKAARLIGDAVSMWPNNHLNALYGREHFLLVDSWLRTVDGLEMLDIGCGTGRMSRYFAARGARVAGFDFSAKSIDLARRLTQGDNPVYRVCSVFELADEERYDVALSWGVLTIACTNREELKDALRRIRRSLKPNGRLILLEPVHKGFLHRVLSMDVREFIEVMTQSNFVVKDVRNLHFWPARLLLGYVPWPVWITIPIYRFGQLMMQRMSNFNFGDYKAIFAVSIQ